MDGVARPMARKARTGKNPATGHRHGARCRKRNAGVAANGAGAADARRSEGTRTFLRAVNIVLLC